MTREEAINMLHGIRVDNLNLDDAYTKDKYEALEMAIKALEQEPTPKNDLGVDLISRADARKVIIDHQYSDSFCEEHNIDHSINMGMALIVLSDLPSVTPQESRKGQWITKPHVYGVTYCSECDFELKIDNTNYCPNCGAKMVEPQESEAEDGNDD